jgi:polar amino acid transport system substrate-binding protein
MGSQQKIEQVLVNLLTNACHAIRERTQRIEVRTWHTDGCVVFSVKDEGEGIAPNDLKRITEPFFTTKRDSGGTGLGLSVSSNIVKNHGGTMEFASEPGSGTVATVRLPIPVQ